MNLAGGICREFKLRLTCSLPPRLFQEGLSVRGVLLALFELDHQEINVQVEVTWHILQTIVH